MTTATLLHTVRPSLEFEIAAKEAAEELDRFWWGLKCLLNVDSALIPRDVIRLQVACNDLAKHHLLDQSTLNYDAIKALHDAVMPQRLRQVLGVLASFF